MNGDDHLERALTTLRVRSLPAGLRARTLVRARTHLAPSPGHAKTQAFALPAYAASIALLSADAVFVADACTKIGRAFGG